MPYLIFLLLVFSIKNTTIYWNTSKKSLKKIIYLISLDNKNVKFKNNKMYYKVFQLNFLLEWICKTNVNIFIVISQKRKENYIYFLIYG